MSTTDATTGSGSTSGATTSGGGSSTGGTITAGTGTATDASAGSSSGGGGPVCGNDLLEVGEACDGTDLAGSDCLALGFDAGTLACAGDCSDFDASACVSWLACAEQDLGSAVGVAIASGDTTAEDAELDPSCAGAASPARTMQWTAPGDGLWHLQAHGTGFVASLSLWADCGPGDELACALDPGGGASIVRALTAGTTVAVVVAGQGAQVGPWTLDITAQGPGDGGCCWASGGLGCVDEACQTSVCLVDPSCCDTAWTSACADGALVACDACTTAGLCNNGTAEIGEACDGLDFGGSTCASFGFDSGTLSCAADCSSISTAACVQSCGNGVVDGDDTCDGLDTGGVTCVDLGYDSGTVGCTADCTALDPAACVQNCGDGSLDADEVCDGADLGGESCTTLGFDAGTLSCQLDCNGFDTSACVENCGNGSIDAGEVCDGADLGGESCVSQGFDTGTLACATDCSALVTGGCADYGGDCCDPLGHTGPGCDDATCTQTVCAADPSCCSGDWSAACAALADAQCGACGAFFDFSGVLTDLDEASLLGWTECYVDTYANAGTALADILAQCDQGHLLMGCRATGTTTLLVAANAPRADVTFDTGITDVPHDANGVGWYFSDTWSWGFAPQGAPIHRDSCDIIDSIYSPGTLGEQRLCYQTYAGTISQGWRCGLADELNGSIDYERVFYQRP
ncbi:MAG: hypothetical protein U0168_24170 [Nannocystaceae bacterium]